MIFTPFHQRFVQLALINILSNLLVPLAGLVDLAFLGHLADIRHLAGVALATVLFNYIYWSFGFLRMGTTGMTAQAVGRADLTAVLLIGLRNGLIAIGLGVLVLCLQYPLRELGFALLNATSEVKASGQAYYNALVWGAPATLLNFVLVGWYLGREQGGKVFVLSAVGNGANVILNYWFIVRWGWASTGAGAATAASQYLMLLIGLGLIAIEASAGQWRSHLTSGRNLWVKLLDPTVLRSTFTLNGDILVRTFALVSTFALFTNVSSALGTEVLATNTVLLQVVTLAAYFIDGLAFATESFAGIFRGKGEVAQLMALIRIAGAVSLGSGLVFAIAFITFRNSLFGLLTNHEDVLNQINQYVFWLLPVLGFGSIAYMLDGYFLGLTEGRILRRSTLIAAVVGCVPMAIAVWPLQNSQMLWLAMALFMATRAFTLGVKVPGTLK